MKEVEHAHAWHTEGGGNPLHYRNALQPCDQWTKQKRPTGDDCVHTAAAVRTRHNVNDKKEVLNFQWKIASYFLRSCVRLAAVMFLSYRFHGIVVVLIAEHQQPCSEMRLRII